MPERVERIVAIDMLKGVLIVWVMLIHGLAFPRQFLMVHLINHAVPVFVILFGLNSELWWQRRTAADLGAWYRSRARRLYVPVWIMLVGWWTIVWLFPRPSTPLSWKLAVWHVIGDLRLVATGWFVTMILQLVVLFPALHFLARRFGHRVVLGLGLTALGLSTFFGMELLFRLGVIGIQTFSPRFLGHVTFGMLLARRPDWLRWQYGLAAAALVVPGWVCHAEHILPAFGPYAERLLDMPLTLALLVLMGLLARFPWAARPLTWLGVHSWGLYVGQILVHNGVEHVLGLRRVLEQIGSVPYALFVLLAGASILVVAGNTVLNLLTRGAAPLPTR